MRRWIGITILSLALAFTSYWGYKQFKEKEVLRVHAENNYQRSFHNLTYHIDLLYDKIGTTLALNTKETVSPQMLDIWQLTSDAQNDVSQLPLGLLPFNKTESFLADIGEFSYHVAIRDLDNEPLSEEERERLSGLYESSDQIRKELRNVQHKVFHDQLRWVDVQLALANNDRENPNSIIDGFTAIEDHSTGFNEVHFQNLASDFPSQQTSYQYIGGDSVTEGEIISIIRSQFDLTEDLEIDLQKSGEGAQLPTYSGSFSHEGQHGYVEVSEKGGYILSYMISRDLSPGTISLHDAEKKADELLKEQGFEGVKRFRSSQYDDSGLFQYVVKKDDVWLYPDKLMIKVALDTGDIISFSATDYYRNHRERDLEEPKLSLEEAKENVSVALNVEDQHLAVIEDQAGNEVLTYSFFGTLNNDTYQVFIDANTGDEVFVERMNDVENIWG